MQYVRKQGGVELGLVETTEDEQDGGTDALGGVERREQHGCAMSPREGFNNKQKSITSEQAVHFLP